jgi:hypothetical protein
MRNAMIMAGMLSAAAALAGCHSPKGGMMPFTGGSTTYQSTERSPKSVRLVDTRTSEVVFEMDIPVGKELTLDFQKGKGDDPVRTPDLMRYQLFDIGTIIGRLRNSMTVPNAQCRRLEMWIREAPEWASPPPGEELRVDQVKSRQAWWTPQGGPMPAQKSPGQMYDD